MKGRDDRDDRALCNEVNVTWGVPDAIRCQPSLLQLEIAGRPTILQLLRLGPCLLDIKSGLSQNAVSICRSSKQMTE